MENEDLVVDAGFTDEGMSLESEMIDKGWVIDEVLTDEGMAHESDVMGKAERLMQG